MRPARCRPVIDIAPRIGGEHLKQSAEVAVGARGDEFLGDQAMLGCGDIETSTASGGEDLLPRPPGKLPTRWRGPVNYLGYNIEGHLEDVVQDKGDPLGRAELLHYHQQGQPDAVDDGDPVGWVSCLEIGKRGCCLDLARSTGVFSAGLCGFDLIQAQTAGHHDQPAAVILHAVGTGAQKAHERVLDEVLGGTDVPEHPEGEVNQVRPVIPEYLADLPTIMLCLDWL